MSEDQDGQARAAAVEQELEARARALLERHRPWLEAQLAPLVAEARAVDAELKAALARRAEQQAQLKKLNPPRRTRDDLQPEVLVAAFLLAAGGGLYASWPVPPGWPALGPGAPVLVVLTDLLLLGSSFLALTPLWSVAPRAPRPPPALPALPEPTALLPAASGSWRHRLESAQGALRKWQDPERPEEADLMRRALGLGTAALQSFVAEGRAWLANLEGDHLAWRAVAWPRAFTVLRRLGFLALPLGLLGLGLAYGERGLVHGAIAVLGAGAAGFFRGSMVGFVDPPHDDED